MKKLLLLFIASLTMTQACADTDLSTTLTTEKQKFSYAVGVQVANNLKQNGDVDVDALTQALKDVFSNTDLKLTAKEMQEIMSHYQEKQFSEQMKKSMTNRKAGIAFLAENKTKEGVIETLTGLQYKVLKEGTGKNPSSSDQVKVHYHGKLIDGTVFDSSVDREEPIVLGVGQVIKGWQEALPLMKEGAKWQLYIPSDLAYGERGAGASIAPNSTLIFDIELISIE